VALPAASNLTSHGSGSLIFLPETAHPCSTAFGPAHRTEKRADFSRMLVQSTLKHIRAGLGVALQQQMGPGGNRCSTVTLVQNCDRNHSDSGYGSR
jgi:hypothetical protein